MKEQAWSPEPWEIHWTHRHARNGAAKTNEPMIANSIYSPIPGQRYGSRAVACFPAWNEVDGEVWDAWLGGSEADLNRIVACVNGCAGIKNPGGIPEVVEALQEIRDRLGIRDDFTPLGIAVELRPILDKALRKLEESHEEKTS